MKFSATFIAISLLAPLACMYAAERVDFVRDVRPIFEQHCYDCHSAAEQESGLRLDVKGVALKGGDNHGPDIVPGKAKESPLIRFITAPEDDDLLMPPGEKLSPAEIAILTRWIDEGAVWPDGVDRVQLRDKRDHWSFKPLASASMPDNSEHEQQQSVAPSIDGFIAARLKEHGLAMSPAADAVAWLRRVTFDLTGLPPTPAEVRDFERQLANEPQDAGRERVYAEAVDRLLASVRYGEHWAQHWLDVVRYADTHGFEVNTERPNAWPYRDYVIRAFNNDTPYDRFIREQIVGDALGEDAATGFLITASVLLPGQIGKDEASQRLARQDSLDEIVNNVSQTFLGLSVGCARCHDHKFDPISAHDYYAMQALVAGVEYADREIDSPAAAAARRQAIEPLRQQLLDLQNRLAAVAMSRANGSQPRATNPRENREEFAPLEARFVRFTIHDANLHPSLGLIEPCLDEFEIFTDEPMPQNVALASHGTKVTASGSRTSAAHKLAHVNDGQYGNARSWMSDTKGRGWVQFELLEPTRIAKVVWSRDRNGKLKDRLPTLFTLEAGLTSDSLATIGGVTTEVRQLLTEKADLEAKIKAAETLPLAFAGKFRQPDTIHLLARGDPEQPQAEVLPAVLSELGKVSLGKDAPEQERRRALAAWLASAENPLTARVMVNRIWQGHFGAGLVQTPSDFGNNGALPTHPRLLDWLASEFIRSGWSVKHLHRLIVLSQTYRQTSASQPHAAEIDADVQWLWRYPSRRLEAESIRDSMLAVSGQLNLTMFGRGFDLFDKRGGLSGFRPVETLSSANQRRMIFAHKVRRETEAVFGAFDCPDAGQSTATRRASTTPIQALNLFNSNFTLAVSAAFAERVRREVGDDLASQIEQAYELAFSRLPTDAERDGAVPVVRQHGLAVLCRALFNSNEFLFVP